MTIGPSISTPARQAGFSLIEVLIAIGILAIGLISVASIFPTAIFIQKQAVNDALRQQNIRSADAMLQGKGLAGETLFAYTEDIRNTASMQPSRAQRNAEGVRDLEFDVYALSEIDVNTADAFRPNAISGSYAFPNESFIARWPIEDRSYPSIIPAVDDREFYWTPLVQRGIEASDFIADWRVFAFILRRNASTDIWTTADARIPNGTVCANPFGTLNPPAAPIANPFEPKVYRVRLNGGASGSVVTLPAWATGLIQVGDPVLGDNGQVFRVSQTNGSDLTLSPAPNQSARRLRALWFAPPPENDPNGNSPAQDIRELSNNIVRLPPLP